MYQISYFLLIFKLSTFYMGTIAIPFTVIQCVYIDINNIHVSLTYLLYTWYKYYKYNTILHVWYHLATNYISRQGDKKVSMLAKLIEKRYNIVVATYIHVPPLHKTHMHGTRVFRNKPQNYIL